MTGTSICALPRFTILLGLCFSLSALPAYAQDSEASIKLGDTDLTPSVRITYLTNSNAFLTPENETEATGFAVAPRVDWVANRRLLELSLSYVGDFANYSESALSYNDHSILAELKADLSSRQRFDAFAFIRQEHEQLGTLSTRGIADENSDQVEKAEFGLGASFTYGAREAKGNIEAGVRLEGRNFLNQETLTDGRDRIVIEPYGIFSYRLSSSARATVEVSLDSLNFDNEQLDHDDVSILTGVSLAQGRKTSGTARLGFTQAKFSEVPENDETSFLIDVVLSYKPVSFATFDFLARRELDNADVNQVTQLATQDTLRLDWRHSWSGRLSSNAFVSRQAREFDNCALADLATVSAGLEFGYAVRRWVEFGVGVSSTERRNTECSADDTNASDLDFTRQQFTAHVRFNL